MKIFRNSKGRARRQAGETLAETIIALSILAIGITIASTIILNSMRNLANAKNRVLAVNIAREGIEAMRNIRDTNWLYYSDRRRTCWNHDPSVDFCTGLNPIPPGVYIIYKMDDNSWQLAQADVALATDADDDTIPDNDPDPVRARLSLVDIDDTLDSDNDTDPENDPDFYNHKDAIAVDSLGTEVKTTPFTRYLTIEYLENEPSGTSAIAEPNDSINTKAEWDSASQSELNRMRVTSTVEWIKGAATHKAELTTIITDHLGREDLES